VLVLLGSRKGCARSFAERLNIKICDAESNTLRLCLRPVAQTESGKYVVHNVQLVESMLHARSPDRQFLSSEVAIMIGPVALSIVRHSNSASVHTLLVARFSAEYSNFG